MKIIFWEKPGCMGNARQRALLTASGHELDTRSLPDHHWNRDELLAFLDPLPVADWFNRGARRVKDGEVDPDDLDREEALAILLADPILVRRPLLEIGEERLVGFDLTRIEELCGELPKTTRIQEVRKLDLEKCPGEGLEVPCGTPRD